MTLKIQMSHFNDKNEHKQGNGSKSDIFPWDIFKSDIFS